MHWLMKEVGEDENTNGKREVERGEEKTVTKKRCVNPIPSDVFEEFGPLEDSESFEDSCGFSECVLAVTVVLVFPSSVGVRGEDFLSVSSECELVESQSFSLSLESVKISFIESPRRREYGGHTRRSAANV